MKKIKPTFSHPTSADLAEATRRLRYMTPENIAKDFASPRERAAIAAVFKWLGYNGIVAWELKRGHVYTTVAASSRVRRDGPHQAVVVPVDAYERAHKLLAGRQDVEP
jgi:hypothetical protein